MDETSAVDFVICSRSKTAFGVLGADPTSRQNVRQCFVSKEYIVAGSLVWSGCLEVAYCGDLSASKIKIFQAQWNELAQPTGGNVDQAAFVVWRACVTDRLSSLLSGLRTERLTKEESGRIEGAIEPEGKGEPRGQGYCNKR